MKITHIFYPLLFSLLFFTQVMAQKTDPLTLPDSIYSGKQGRFHVQGVAVDQEKGFVYFSYTDKLVKTDLEGRFLGSVTGLVGHLGDIDFDPKTNKIYGSLEFKQDAIGKGISKTLGINQNSTGFYIAIFDASKITQPNISAEDENVLRTVYLNEVVKDHLDTVMVSGTKYPHRYASSGIDGTTLAPDIGKSKDSKKYLYVAYGIYGDTTRYDNDYQVILQYDISDWDKYGKTLYQDNLHQSGPKKPREKYFVKTGNTTYGIQNMAYDEDSGNLFAAVYRGKKSHFPNYGIFVIDRHQKAQKAKIKSDDKLIKVKTLSLLKAGPKDDASGIRGWHFDKGTTGLRPLGDGYFYISHPNKTKDGQQETTVYKYKWIGDENQAFERVK